VDLRNVIEQGGVPGPRLLVAGNYVSSTGGAGDARQFSIYVDVPIVRNLADGPEEVTKAVRTNLKNGADFIKILATGAVLSKGIPPGSQQYSDAEIQAAVTEARRWGRQVAAHAHGADGIKAAIRAGVRTVDHGSMLDDEAVAMLKGSSSTYYVPTLYTSDVIDTSGLVPSPRRSASGRSRTRNTPASGALAAGPSIGVGSDAAVHPPRPERARAVRARPRWARSRWRRWSRPRASTRRSWAGPTHRHRRRRASSRTSWPCPAIRSRHHRRRARGLRDEGRDRASDDLARR
jgi:imidazolonepropionase-like amidohydrolase